MSLSQVIIVRIYSIDINILQRFVIVFRKDQVLFLFLPSHVLFTKAKTRCTQRDQNARLDVTSLTSVIKYCEENNKIKPNM